MNDGSREGKGDCSTVGENDGVIEGIDDNKGNRLGNKEIFGSLFVALQYFLQVLGHFSLPSALTQVQHPFGLSVLIHFSIFLHVNLNSDLGNFGRVKKPLVSASSIVGELVELAAVIYSLVKTVPTNGAEFGFPHFVQVVKHFSVPSNFKQILHPCEFPFFINALIVLHVSCSSNVENVYSLVRSVFGHTTGPKIH